MRDKNLALLINHLKFQRWHLSKDEQELKLYLQMYQKPSDMVKNDTTFF